MTEKTYIFIDVTRNCRDNYGYAFVSTPDFPDGEMVSLEIGMRELHKYEKIFKHAAKMDINCFDHFIVSHEISGYLEA